MRTGGYESNFKSTGDRTVDMVLSMISFYRKAGRPLKSIMLSHWNYKKFVDYNKMKAQEWFINQNMDVDINEYDLEKDPFYCDNVCILEAKTFLVENFKLEFWPTVRTEADDEKYLS